MPCIKIIVGTFRNSGKAGKPALGTQAGEVFIASGKQLVRIRLVAYVPDNGILRAVKNTVERNGQFNHTEITGEMPAILSHNLYNFMANLLCQSGKL